MENLTAAEYAQQRQLQTHQNLRLHNDIVKEINICRFELSAEQGKKVTYNEFFEILIELYKNKDN